LREPRVRSSALHWHARDGPVVLAVRSSPARGPAAAGCAAAGCCRAAWRAWTSAVRTTADSSGLGLRPATGSSDAAPLEGCARVPPSAIERARASLRFDFVKQPRGVRCTDGTLMLSCWVSSDAFGSGIPRAPGTAATTACTFAVGSAADGCRAAGPAAGALPPDRVPCIVSKYSPTALDSPRTGHYVQNSPRRQYGRARPSERSRGSPRGPAVVPDRAAAQRVTAGGPSLNCVAEMQPKWPCLKLWPLTGHYV
jgi:hypothetical protein